ncbi:MAG: TetR/AcrR family transcriptional regulator [Clostridiales bacterium]|nr:TetR/AcrR family transcriptional regulator [Clostridiales bacterium]
MSKREQNKIEVRHSILKASRKLFTANSYDGTLMTDIAEKANVSKATVYNYFPNKESLLIGIEQELILQITGMIEDDPGKAKSSEAMLREALEALVQASAEYPDLAKLITYLNSCEDSALYETRLPLEKLFIKLIEGAKEEGSFKDGIEAERVADIIMGIYLITLFQWEHIDRYTPAQLGRKLDQTYKEIMADCVYA